MFIIHSFSSEYLILAWLVPNVSTHDGEETWSMTLTTTQENRSLEREQPEERKGKEQKKRKKHSLQNLHLSQRTHAS